MVTNPLDGLEVIFNGFKNEDLVQIDNRLSKSTKSSQIKYLSKHWNHILVSKRERIHCLQTGKDAAKEREICAWVHHDPRDKRFISQLDNARKQLLEGQAALIYMSNLPHKSKQDYLNLKEREEARKALEGKNRHLNKNIRMLYINLTDYPTTVNVTRQKGSNFFFCDIKSETLEWYQSRNKLDLDLSERESKMTAIQVLQAARIFANIPSKID